MKKNIFSITLFMLVLFLILTTNVFAAEQFGKVAVISEGTHEVENNNTKTVTVKYTTGNLKWAEKDLNVGRNVDGYWIGIKIDAPSDRAEVAQYKRGGTTVTFNDVKDGNDYVNAWINITEEKLKKIKEDGEPYVVIEYDFDWNGDGNFTDQKIIVEVDPDNIKLEDVPQTHAKVTINSIVGNRTFTVKKGESLKSYLSKDEMAILEQLLTAPAGMKYLGIFKGEKIFGLDEKINEDTVLTVKFDKALDETPKTGVNESMLSYLLTIGISLMGIVSIKKKI